MKSVDVAIVGGGIVGTVLAKGLSERAKLSVALIDAADPKAQEKDQHNFNPFTDTRVIALAKRTIDEFAQLGIHVEALAKHFQGEMPPLIKHIEVSDQGHVGLVELNHSDYNIPAFGRVVSLSALTRLVLDASADYTHIAPARVNAVTQHQQHCEVQLDSGDNLSAKLLILADGGRSGLAQQLGIDKSVSEYNQTALVFNVHTQLPHENKAYERFTATGPLAFLPFDSEINNEKATDNGFSVVWTVEREEADLLKTLDIEAFITKLQNAFGYRQGKILRVSNIASYPLALTTANQITSHRTVLVGNAAQALHPIAGQGFNLGLRDISTLIDVLTSARTENINASNEKQDGFDAGAFNVINSYKQCRKNDRVNTITLTDTLVRTFSNSYLPTVVGRNLSLLAFAATPMAKRAFVKQTTGYVDGSSALRITRTDNTGNTVDTCRQK